MSYVDQFGNLILNSAEKEQARANYEAIKKRIQTRFPSDKVASIESTKIKELGFLTPKECRRKDNDETP